MDVEVSISIPDMHMLLWVRRDRNDCTTVVQSEIAEQMGVTRARIGHVLTRMEKQGRIRRIDWRGPYKVEDPAGFS